MSAAHGKHVMLSYHWDNKDVVSKIYKFLKARNIPVWMDIHGGISFNLFQSMADGVENAAVVCCFMTPKYQNSRNCQKELLYAERRHVSIIPCRMCREWEPSTWLGLVTAGLVWIDFRDTSEINIDLKIDKLIDQLRVVAGDKLQCFSDSESVPNTPQTESILPLLYRPIRNQVEHRQESGDSPTTLLYPSLPDKLNISVEVPLIINENNNNENRHYSTLTTTDSGILSRMSSSESNGTFDSVSTTSIRSSISSEQPISPKRFASSTSANGDVIVRQRQEQNIFNGGSGAAVHHLPLSARALPPPPVPPRPTSKKLLTRNKTSLLRECSSAKENIVPSSSMLIEPSHNNEHNVVQSNNITNTDHYRQNETNFQHYRYAQVNEHDDNSSKNIDVKMRTKLNKLDDGVNRKPNPSVNGVPLPFTALYESISEPKPNLYEVPLQNQENRYSSDHLECSVVKKLSSPNDSAKRHGITIDYSKFRRPPKIIGDNDNVQFCCPSGVAVSKTGLIYVCDHQGQCVKVIPLLGSSQCQLIKNFIRPKGIHVDQLGRVLLTEQNRLLILDSELNILRVVGDHGSSQGEFNVPWGVTTDHQSNIYVCDQMNNRVQKFDSDGNFILDWGYEGEQNGQFYYPHFISICGNKVVVSDQLNHRVQVFDLNGKYRYKLGEMGSEPGQFSCPFGVLIDSQSDIVVADHDNRRIQFFDSNGEIKLMLDQEANPLYDFEGVNGLTLTPDGGVIITDYKRNGKHRLFVFT